MVSFASRRGYLPKRTFRSAIWAAVSREVHVKSEQSYRLRLLLTQRRNLKRKMLRARAALWQEYVRLHKVVVAIVRRDELCQRFMSIPGVGPINALAYKTSIDDPHRFRRWQSGTSIDVQGHISKAGDSDVRHPLYEAANIMLTRHPGFSNLKACRLKIAKKRGHKRA